MKFGKYLSQQAVTAWKFYYLSYNSIKKSLVHSGGTEAEKAFQDALEKELAKINSFFTLESDQLFDKVLQTKQLIKNGDLSSERDAELNRYIEELLNLERYQRLNYMGFMKLLKKHDKHRGVGAKEWFMLRVDEQPFVKRDLDHILVQISETYKSLNLARTKKTVDARKEGKDAPSGVQNFERKTTKYWVPLDRVLHVQTSIIKHLPIDIFDKRSTRSSSLTTSVYYDSPALLLYHERLTRQEGAVNLRMRTYGFGVDQPIVFVERKTHHESWVGESSVKERFAIKNSKLYDYLHGKYDIEEKLKKMKERGEMKEAEVEKTLKLSNEIQQLVTDNNLEPKLTTRYIRTAFQLGRDATVRMSLDTQLHMIKEPGYQNHRWGRDLSLPIDESEVCWFPYAILEVKLNLPSGMETPQWITNLLQENSLIQIHKFSKFIHGLAVLDPDNVKILPTWLDLLAEKQQEQNPMYKLRMPYEVTTTMVAKRDEFSEEKQRLGNFPITAPAVAIKIESPKETQHVSSRKKEKAPNELELDESAGLLINDELTTMGEPVKKKPPKDPWYVKAKKWYDERQKKKRIQIPLKIDPKTFFANERTLLRWLSFLIIVQSIGLAMMRFSEGYTEWRIGGLAFVLISLVYMIYSIYQYQKRRRSIETKSKGPYSDKYGPIILVSLLLAAVIANIVITYQAYFVGGCSGKSLLTKTFVTYSPNGLLYHPGIDRVVAVQDNTIFYIDYDKRSTNDHFLSGKLRGSTYSNPDSPYLYVASLIPSAIIEFDMNTDSARRIFPISIPGSNSTHGVTGVAFVPNPNHPEGGQFWVSSDTDGNIYVYDLPLSNSQNNTAVLTGTLNPLPGVFDIRGITYHQDSNRIYGVTGQWVWSSGTDGKAVVRNLLGFPSLDGVALKGNGAFASIFVACKECNNVWHFSYAHETVHSGRCYPENSATSLLTGKAL